MKNILVIGGGFTSGKRLDPHTLQFAAPVELPGRDNVTTIDSNKECRPSFVWDLNVTPWPINKPIHSHAYDEVHAYEVLEHLGKQGDADSLFAHFGECWLALKPGGLLLASVPSFKSMWAWGDPSHTRVITSGTITFLMRKQYEMQIGRTSMSDFCSKLIGNWELVAHQDDGESYRFVLRAL